jgi:carboxylesterase
MQDPAAPFALGDGADACLLLHGLTGAPSEVRPIGEALASAGIRAMGPLLPGHGTRPESLQQVSRDDLLDAARQALRELQGARRVYVCGLSMGALLSLRLAAKSDPALRIDALALLAPAIEFAGTTWLFTQVIGRLPPVPLPWLLDKGGRDIQERKSAPAADDRSTSRADGSYRAVPIGWGRELRLLSDEALAAAPAVKMPTLILQGARDRTVAAAGARKLAGVIGSTDVKLHIYERSGHVLPLDFDKAAVCAAVVQFFQRAEG